MSCRSSVWVVSSGSELTLRNSVWGMHDRCPFGFDKEFSVGLSVIISADAARQLEVRGLVLRCGSDNRE